jgi:6-phosphofructokinase
MSTKKGLIGILTGGGDVPGLNPAIRAVTIRALREGYQVVGIRHGWLGAISILRDQHADNSEHFQILTEEIVNRAARTGGTFLHTSRTNPSAVKKEEVPEALRATFNLDTLELSAEVIQIVEGLGIDSLIPIGGDDTRSFASRYS